MLVTQVSISYQREGCRGRDIGRERGREVGRRVGWVEVR